MANELITLETIKDTYPILVPGSDALELLRTNLGGAAPMLGDLNRIKFPAQGAVKWTVSGVGGEELIPYLEGVMLFATRQRSYWADPNPSNNPPDCSSQDCLRGDGPMVEDGKIEGYCEAVIDPETQQITHEKCPFNEFGTAVKIGGAEGRGKACKERMLVFMLRSGQMLPDVLSIPASSLRIFSAWRMKLPVAYYNCIVRFQLEKGTSKDNVVFSKLLPFYMGPLDPSAVKSVEIYKLLLGKMFEAAAQSLARTNDDAE